MVAVSNIVHHKLLELLAAGGLYARMWADYEKSVSWRITSAQEVE